MYKKILSNNLKKKDFIILIKQYKAKIINK